MLNSNRQKAFDSKLTDALLDARRKVLQNGNDKSEDELFDGAENAIYDLRAAMIKQDLKECKKCSDEAIAFLMSYQIKFL